jgi:hypothetical protein
MAGLHKRTVKPPVAVAIGPAGDPYIAEGSGSRIPKVPADGTIPWLPARACGIGGDGPATPARLAYP